MGPHILWMIVALGVGCTSFNATGVVPDDGGGSGGRDDASTVDSDAAVETPRRCGTPGVFVDDFAGPVIASYWRPGAGATITQDSGSLLVRADPFVTTRFAGLASKLRVDLTDARAMVEIDAIDATGPESAAVFSLALDDDNYLRLRQADGDLFMEIGDAPGVDRFAMIPYDPDAHRFWQIRESAGSVFFETSADGASWNLQSSFPAPSFIDTLAIRLGVVVNAFTSDQVSVRFASLNSRTPGAGWCSADTLQDDFEDGVIGSEWLNTTILGVGCQLYEAGGLAHFDQSEEPESLSVCWYGSSAGYDLTGTSVYMNVPTIFEFDSGWSTFIALSTHEGSELTLSFADNQLCGRAVTSAGDVLGGLDGCIPYDGALAFWSVGEAQGDVFWRVSDDRINWQEILRGPAPFAVTDLQVTFGTRVVRELSDDIALIIEAFNTP